MFNKDNIINISNLRFKTMDALKQAKRSPVFLFHRTTPKGVLLSLEKFQEMEDIIEDYYLSLRAEEFEQEDKGKTKWTTHDELKNKLHV